MNRSVSPLPRRLLVLAAAITSAAVLTALVPWAAGAAPAKREVAYFDVVVKGVQKTAESFHYKPENECDVTDNSTVSEKVVFKSKPMKFAAYELPGLTNPMLAPAVAGKWPTVATVTRHYTPQMLVPPASPQCGENDGTGEDAEVKSDCGTKKVGNWPLWLEFDERKKGALRLSARDSKDPFENCLAPLGELGFPYLLVEDTHEKAIFGDLPADELFDPGLGKIIVLGGGTQKAEEPSVSVKTSVEWDVSLTRVRR